MIYIITVFKNLSRLQLHWKSYLYNYNFDIVFVIWNVSQQQLIDIYI